MLLIPHDLSVSTNPCGFERKKGKKGVCEGKKKVKKGEEELDRAMIDRQHTSSSVGQKRGGTVNVNSLANDCRLGPGIVCYEYCLQSRP